MKAIYEFVMSEKYPGPVGFIVCYAGGNRVMYDFFCVHGDFLLHASTITKLKDRIDTLRPIYGRMWTLSPSILPSQIPQAKQAYETMCMLHDVSRPGDWVD